MNAAFGLPQAGVVDRTNPNVGGGWPKAFAIAEKLFEVESLKTAGRWFGKGQAHERDGVR